MLTQAKTIVLEQETRFQEGLHDAKQRLSELKQDARLQYRKAQFTGTKAIFEVASNTEPKISALLEDSRLPTTPLHSPLLQRIERFNTPIIADYDQLNTKKIVKQLRGMSTWNLFKVDRRERLTKNRKTIFNAVTKEHTRNLRS